MNQQSQSPTATANATDIAELIRQAVAHHEAGRLQEAESFYREVLQAQPVHPDANHNLGVLAMQTNRPAAALPHLKAALDAQPAQGQYWLTYIAALLQAGQADLASQILAQGRQRGLQGPQVEKLAARLGEQPTERQSTSGRDAAPASREIGLAMELFGQGRYTEVEAMARALTQRFPRHGFGWQLLGVVLKQLDRDESAVAPLQRAIELMPGSAEAHYNLGLVMKGLSRLSDAEACYRRALGIKPDLVEALNNLSAVLQAQGRHKEAETSVRRVIELRPNHAEAFNNLGVILQEQSKLHEAEASFRRAIELNPEFAEAWNNYGHFLLQGGRSLDAETALRRALALNPAYVEAHHNLGNISLERRQFDEAVKSYRAALDAAPDFGYAHSNLLFALNYHPDKSGEEIYEAYREYDERFGKPQRAGWREHGNSREVGRRLKVGYVSPDFNIHAVTNFLEPLLASHDKAAVEVYAYAELKREDEVTARYRSYVDHWLATRGMTDDALAERIRADGIDILVDVAGHTAGNRLEVFARKPAPVSVSWLGYSYTTGLSAIDYFLTDTTCAPEGSEGLFAETPWRLAVPSLVYRPTLGMGEVSALPALERGQVTFGTLTRAVRINHRTIRVWAEILKQVPRSRLVIDSRNFQDDALRESLEGQFAEHGIGRERLEIGFHSPPWEVLRGMDIGLDCFPHNSGTTLFETLYMGVPYVTLAGRPSVGRLGGSILVGAGHPEWIARSEAEYIEKAVALASDLPKLAEIRSRLRGEMADGPLLDEAGFARHVEAAYRDMFGRWASQVADQ